MALVNVSGRGVAAVVWGVIMSFPFLGLGLVAIICVLRVFGAMTHSNKWGTVWGVFSKFLIFGGCHLLMGLAWYFLVFRTNAEPAVGRVFISWAILAPFGIWTLFQVDEVEAKG